MKSLLLALFLTSAVPEKELFVGLYCPDLESAQRVASIGVSYALGLVATRAGCVIDIAEGYRTQETRPFQIGTERFTFIEVQTDSGKRWVLNPLGEGYEV